MGFRVLRRAKTLILTFGVVSLGMYVLLNTLAPEISLKDIKISELQNDGIQLLQSQKSSIRHNAFQDVFAAQGQRKQKTLLNNEYNPVDDNYAYEQNENNVNDFNNYEKPSKHLKLNKNDVFKLEYGPNQLHLANKDHDKDGIGMFNDKLDNDNDDITNDDISEEEDLYDQNDEDEEYVEEQNNDNYHYDDVTNVPFKLGGVAKVNDETKHINLELDVKNAVMKDHVNSDSGFEKSSEDNNDTIKKELTENGIYWSEYVEKLIPKGKSYSEVTREIGELRKQVVKILDKPSWDKCGRPMNAYAVLSDETKLCVRYRQPHSSFIYGEALSFYLSRLLKMDSIPTVILAKTNSTSNMWRGVNISSLTWEEDKMVAFIAWVDEINSGYSSKAYMPPLILEAYRTGKPVTTQIIQTSQRMLNDPSAIISIVQWGTMIVFDYLTGNYDRVASMQDAENRESDPKIIEDSIRNLKKSSTDGKLWLIDNECGLLDAYQLLEPYSSNTRFTTFHRQMLQTMCVFEMPLVQALRKLSQQPSPHTRLQNFAISFEPLLIGLTKDRHYEKFSELFDKRLAEVISWIDNCKNLQS